MLDSSAESLLLIVLQTTLSTLVAEHLRTSPAIKDSPIAKVFVRKHASADDIEFTDAVLRSIASQVGVASTALKSAAQAGARYSIREALHARVAACRRAFVILDDIDLVRHWRSSPLHKELASLQQRGLKFMMTSRLQATDKPLDCTCDADPCQHAGELLKVYWECRDCGFICCDTCHTGGAKCYWYVTACDRVTVRRTRADRVQWRDKDVHRAV